MLTLEGDTYTGSSDNFLIDAQRDFGGTGSINSWVLRSDQTIDRSMSSDTQNQLFRGWRHAVTINSDHTIQAATGDADEVAIFLQFDATSNRTCNVYDLARLNTTLQGMSFYIHPNDTLNYLDGGVGGVAASFHQTNKIIDVIVQDNLSGATPTQLENTCYKAHVESLQSNATMNRAFYITICRNAAVNWGIFDESGADWALYGALQLGSSQEASIEHNGSNLSIINATGNTYLTTSAPNADLILGVNDGGVAKTITWNADVDKLQHSAGTFDFDDDNILTTGTISLVSDSNKLEIGGESGGDIQIYHDGSDSYIKNTTTGAMIFDNENVLAADSDGKTQFYAEFSPATQTANNVGNYFKATNDLSTTAATASPTLVGNFFEYVYNSNDGVGAFNNQTLRGTKFKNTFNFNSTSGPIFQTFDMTAVEMDIDYTGNLIGFGGNFFPFLINIDWTATASISHQLAGIQQTVTYNAANSVNQIYGFRNLSKALGGCSTGSLQSYYSQLETESGVTIHTPPVHYVAKFPTTDEADFNAATITGNKIYGYFVDAAGWNLTSKTTYGFISTLPLDTYNIAFSSEGADGWMNTDTGGWYFGAGKDIKLYSDTAGQLSLTPPTNTDISIYFEGTTNSGEFKWMEDEDYFLFSDDIIMNTGEAVMFEATTTKLQYGNTGDLDLYTPANKTLELQTVVWKDINLGGAQVLTPSSSYPDIDEFKDSTGTDTGVETLAFAVGESISGSFELQHDYKEGSDFTFHVHWQGIGAPTGTDNVQWELSYTLSRDNVVLAAITTIQSGDTAFDTQYHFKRSDFAAITGTNFKIGDQFLFRLERIAAAGDAYAGDALMATCGLHYQIDTIGSRQIGTK